MTSLAETVRPVTVQQHAAGSTATGWFAYGESFVSSRVMGTGRNDGCGNDMPHFHTWTGADGPHYGFLMGDKVNNRVSFRELGPRDAVVEA